MVTHPSAPSLHPTVSPPTCCLLPWPSKRCLPYFGRGWIAWRSPKLAFLLPGPRTTIYPKPAWGCSWDHNQVWRWQLWCSRRHHGHLTLVTRVPEPFLTLPHNEFLATVEALPARGKPFVVHVTSDMTSWHPSSSTSSLKRPSQLTCWAVGTLRLSQVSQLPRHPMSLTPISSTTGTSHIPTMDLLAILISEGVGREKKKKKSTDHTHQKEIKMLSNYF